MNDVSSLVVAASSGWEPEYLFFWGHRTKDRGAVGKWCLSQWWPCEFEIDHVKYPTAEHFMMAEKARLFEDEVIREQILESTDPAVAKKLGRRVQVFEERTWSRKRSEIVVQGNLAKFGQNPSLKRFLLNTGNAVLVEASPRDRIWGIGMSEQNEDARNPSRWRGMNLLGFALMVVRSELRESGG